nr:MAG TPA: hypothetical protein [Caudoviricetes sp.]
MSPPPRGLPPLAGAGGFGRAVPLPPKSRPYICADTSRPPAHIGQAPRIYPEKS